MLAQANTILQISHLQNMSLIAVYPVFSTGNRRISWFCKLPESNFKTMHGVFIGIGNLKAIQLNNGLYDGQTKPRALPAGV
jgi:hypothetical protein